MDFTEILLHSGANAIVPCDCTIEKTNQVVHIRVKVLQTARVKEAVLFSGEHGFPADTPFYGDGYQKLTQYKGTLKKCDTFTGFTDKDHYKLPQTEGFQTVYNYALIGTGDKTMLIGAASCNRFRTEIRVNGTQM
ncbi:MAG: hypothetical protein ACI4K9_05115, partial [Candidatus Fimenecus sp.]